MKIRVLGLRAVLTFSHLFLSFCLWFCLGPSRAYAVHLFHSAQNQLFQEKEIPPIELEFGNIQLKDLTFDGLIQVQNSLQAGDSNSPSSLAPEDATIKARFPVQKDEYQLVLNLMRNLNHPAHREQIAAYFKQEGINSSPDNLISLSTGYGQRISDPRYPRSKDSKELYYDFFYRQGLELSGDQKAWTLSPKEAKARFLSREVSLPEHFFRQRIGLLSFFMQLHPEEEMTKILQEKHGLRPSSQIEFSPWMKGKEKDLLTPIKILSGLIASTRKYGHFDHDKLVGVLSGIPATEIKKLREKIQAHSGDEPVIVRVLLEDIEHTDPKVMKDIFEDQYMKVMPSYQDSVPIFIGNVTQGSRPLTLPKNTLVFHRKSFHGNNILGQYNPSMVNPHLISIANNKYFEFRLWDKYAPGAIPKTILLRDLKLNNGNVQAPTLSLDELINVVDKSKKTFPNGFVIKGSYDVGTEKTGLITDKTDIIKAYKTYLEGDYEKFREETLARLAGSSSDYVIEELQKHPGYLGHRIKDLLTKPETTLIQNRVAIDKEFRVEVVAGRVLGQGSTLERYGYLHPEEESTVTPEMIAKAEEFAQSIVDKLPDNIRGTPFTMDVALLQDGGFAMIESNPGGNSGFLAMEPNSVTVLNRFLRIYPQLAREGKISQGMEAEEQMNYIKKLMAEFGLDPSTHFPELQFHPDRIHRKYVKVPAIEGYQASSPYDWCLEKTVKELQEKGDKMKEHSDSPVCESESGNSMLREHLQIVEAFTSQLGGPKEDAVKASLEGLAAQSGVEEILSHYSSKNEDKFKALDLIRQYLKLSGKDNADTDAKNQGIRDLKNSIQLCLDQI